MTIANTFTTLVTTVLNRYGLRAITFNEKNFTTYDYNSDCGTDYPMPQQPTEEELDAIVENLNECPVVCESSFGEVSEDNC